MTKPNWKIPLLLSFTLFALGGFAYWLEFSHKPKKEKADSSLKKPLNLPNDDVQIVSFTIRGTKTNFAAKCDELAQKKCKASDSGTWTITSPISAKADSESIKAFLSSMTNATAAETVDMTEETTEKRKALFEEYGLSETKRNAFTTPMIELTLEGGKKLSAWFGVEHPMGDKNFVAAAEDGKVNENTVFLISSYLRTNVDHDLTFFRDKSLYDFNRSEINQFTAKTPQGSMTAKKTDKSWKINDLDVAYDRVETLLSYISQLRAKDFVGSEEALKGTRSVITYKLEGTKDPITLEIFEKKDKNAAKAPKDHHHHHEGEEEEMASDTRYFLKTSVRPDIVELESFAFSQLNKKADDYRNLDVLPADQKNQITHVKIEGKKYKSPLDFTLDKAKWVEKSGLGDAAKVETMLNALEKAKIQNFISPAKKGSDEVKVTLGTVQNPSLHEWTFSIEKTKLYLKDSGNKRNEVYQLEDHLKNTLPFDAASWIIKK